MVEDKYIGLALAISGTLAIGSSFVITKKGLNDAARAGLSASENHSYLKNPIWWAGISTMVLGEAANFAAYTFAQPILITPLGALSVIIGAILASFLLGEELGHLGRLGCTLCMVGALIIVMHAPEDKDITTVDEIFEYGTQPGFLLYCFTVTVLCLVLIYGIAPKHGRSNPLVYISICSLAGSVSIMAIKGFGIAVKLTFGGNNQLTHLQTYVCAAIMIGCIMVQMNYFNKALDTFSTNVVNPIYYVSFTTCTILASVVLFQGFNTTSPIDTVSLLCGFIVIFLGVQILMLSRTQEPPLDTETGGPHSSLETGLMNPRLSLQGRMSIDGWNELSGVTSPTSARHHRRGSSSGGFGVGGVPVTPRSGGHGRNASYRQQPQVLFNAFDEQPPPNGGVHEAVGLHDLREEEEDEGLDADERTRLRGSS
ncbi:DUF803-domain-containing protein [Flagelloscypha sp. PMI_526]|nr:DUF803-domain-containing protein [Flagelloscypha sp. PMI_526]